MKSHGADGLVLGVLTEDGRVDAELCMELLGTWLLVLVHFSSPFVAAARWPRPTMT